MAVCHFLSSFLAVIGFTYILGRRYISNLSKFLHLPLFPFHSLYYGWAEKHTGLFFLPLRKCLGILRDTQDLLRFCRKAFNRDAVNIPQDLVRS